MDCNTEHIDFIKNIETIIQNPTPVMKYICESDRLIFAIPHLIQQVALYQGKQVYLCDLQGKCLTVGDSPIESVQNFRNLVYSLLSKKRT